MQIFIILPSEMIATSFITLGFNHVKIPSKNLGYIRKSGKPIPNGNSIFGIIRSINRTKSHRIIINIHDEPDNSLTRRDTIISNE